MKLLIPSFSNFLPNGDVVVVVFGVGRFVAFLPNWHSLNTTEYFYTRR